jgi:hypothetical protein
MHTKTEIDWYSATYPDAQTTVLLALADGDWCTGWWDDEMCSWYDIDGGPLLGDSDGRTVTHWAHVKVP